MKACCNCWLAWAPWPLTGVYAVALSVPFTGGFAFAMTRENRPVEWASFVLLVAAAGLAVVAGRHAARARERGLFWLAGAGFTLVALEEIAWGQHVFGRPLCQAWADANRQGETTLHNLGPTQGLSELWDLIFAGTGLIAALPRMRPFLGATHVRRVMVPGLVLVAGFALAEIAFHFLPGRSALLADMRKGMRRLDEVIELVVAWLACLWAWQARIALRDGPIAQSVRAADS